MFPGSAAGAKPLNPARGDEPQLAVASTYVVFSFCFAGFCEAERRPTYPAAVPRNAWVFAVFYNVSFATTEGYPLGPSWAYVGPSWTYLGPVLAHLGPVLAHLGPILAPSWPILAPSWPILALSWPYLGPSWPFLAQSWPYLGPILALLGPS